MVGVIIIALWLVCGGLAYAVTFGYFWNEFPALQDRVQYRMDLTFSIIFSLGGPFTLLLALLLSGFAAHGLKWR